MTSTGQLTLEFGHRPALGAEDFLVAESNRAAVGWLDRWPDWPAPALVLHGPAGCGKTHLAQVWRARSGAAPVEASALAGTDLPALLFPRPVLVAEHADAVAGLPAAEAALFHLYNLAGERGGHLLLTAAAAPSRWPIGLPDLASRLRAAPAVALAEPDDALLAAVLIKLFADRQLKVRAEVVTLLVSRMERSFAAARALVEALDRTSLASGRAVTTRLALAVLSGEANRGLGR